LKCQLADELVNSVKDIAHYTTKCLMAEFQKFASKEQLIQVADRLYTDA
jgi:hypothetical protein